MFKSNAVVLLAVFALLCACSDDSSPVDGPPKIEAGFFDGAGLDGGADDVGADAAGPACRTFGIQGTLTIDDSGSSSVTSSFSAATLERKTEITGAKNHVITDQYATVSDFVDEASAVGKQLLTKKTDSGDFGNKITVYSYDSSQRLVKREDPDVIYTYTAWDGEGRPTAGTMDFVAGCGVIDLTIAYDEQARTKTTTFSDPIGSCLGGGSRIDQDRFDANGDRIGMVQRMGGRYESTITITFTGTSQTCK